MSLKTNLFVAVLVCGCASTDSLPGDAVATVPSGAVTMNLNAELSEDEGTATRLEAALNSFLEEARAGSYSEEYTATDQLERYGFFFHGLRGIGQSDEYNAPVVLKSFPFEDGRYFVTVAFTGTRDGAPFLYKIAELEATPSGESYRFGSPFATKTSDMKSRTVGSVTYHFRGSLNEEQAAEFIAFREFLCTQTGSHERELDYYCFGGLDALLNAYGFVFDAGKCNFLRYDLGFTDDEGALFVTGTDNPNYAFEYFGEFLESLPRSEDLYWPFVNGMACYYGGYGLSGDTLVQLKGQFREKLAAEPETDFLEEFNKGRGSSVNRHFSYFVISAFLSEEIIKKHGFDKALQLAYSGENGEEFFNRLKSILGVDETGFHDTIVRLIKT